MCELLLAGEVEVYLQHLCIGQRYGASHAMYLHRFAVECQVAEAGQQHVHPVDSKGEEGQ